MTCWFIGLPAGRQAQRAHKRLHIRARRARIRGILATIMVTGLIGFATAHLLDATRCLPYVTEYLHAGLLILLGLSLVVFAISVGVLNEGSIRREFFRAPGALIPVVSLSLAIATAGTSGGTIHPSLPLAMAWAPLTCCPGGGPCNSENGESLEHDRP